MSKIAKAMGELAEVDKLNTGASVIHRLHPLTKLFCTLGYLLVMLSFPADALTALFPMVLYPVCLYAVSGVPLRSCFYKCRLILPLICAVGIWNPILNRTPVGMLGDLVISEGMVSFLTLLFKGIFALMSSFLLVATTGIEGICYGLECLHLPRLFTNLVLMTYRYLALLMEEVGNRTEAYQLRAPGQKGVRWQAWGSFLGSLLLRCMERSTQLYQSMLLRGFDGSFSRYAPSRRGNETGSRRGWGWTSDLVFAALTVSFLWLFRRVNVSAVLEQWILGAGR